MTELIDQRFSASDYDGNFIVCGDLNDYVDPDTSLRTLIDHPHLVNVIDRCHEEERWTHYWKGGDEYRQLDYLFLSKALAEANPALPEVMRKGLPHRATRYSGPRFDGVGNDTPKASDHAPLVMNINLI